MTGAAEAFNAHNTTKSAVTGQSKVTARQVKEINEFINQVKVPPGMHADNAPGNLYGAVLVRGKVVAAVYKTGVTMLTDEAGRRVGDLMSENADGDGLAQKRLEMIAEALGGSIVMAPLPEGDENASASSMGLTVSFGAAPNGATDTWWNTAVDAQIIAQRDDPEDAA